MATPVRLSPSVELAVDGPVATLTLDRPEKRNALNQETVQPLGQFFRDPPEGIKAAVLTTSGDHFSAGLDLSELQETSVFEGVLHSQTWKRAFDPIQFGSIPVVSTLKGAVIGGGLELALTTHIRVAEPSAFYALPESSRGIFVGGGASVRLPRLIGVPLMADMMLTGRALTAEEGHRAGITQYLVDEGDSLETARGLAERIAENTGPTNYLILQALPRIAEMAPAEGLLFESMVSAVAQGTDEAKERLRDFLEGRGTKVSVSSPTPVANGSDD